MRRSLAAKSIAVLPTLLAASALVFVAMRLLPGDPVLSILSGSVHTVETREALRRELGLDRPLAAQYGSWLWSMLRGDFGGRSLQTREPIGSLLARQAPVTLLLAGYTLALSVLVAVPLGITAAVSRGRWPDLVIRTLAVGGASVPMVLLSFAAIVVVLKLFRWSAPVVYAGPLEDPATHAGIMFWPTLLLSWEYGAHLVRVTRATMIDALDSSYVATARGKGLPERLVILRHALRSSLVPSSLMLALQFGTLLGGALVVETVFGLPGIGRGLVRAALARDYPVVQCIVTVLVFIALLMDLAMEALQGLLDPRIADGG